MSTPEPGFYVTGGSLSLNTPSYVERAADRDLYEGLAAGEYCYVLTSRQMGKSSLMVRTAARLREAGKTAAVIDLTSVGQNVTAEQWYSGLLSRLGEQLGLEDELDDFWLEHERLGPLQRFIAALRAVALPARDASLILFIDEIDAVRSLPFPTDEFFAAIRECYNRRPEDPLFQRLTFCLLGVATPADLIQDTRTTPFNIGRRIDLTDFTLDEAGPLARGLGGEKGSSSSRARQLLKRILHWTGGHPYLTQKLCRALAEGGSMADRGVQGPFSRPRSALHLPHLWVDRVCGELFLSSKAREHDDNLLFVRDRLLRGGADLAALLDLYATIRAGSRVAPDDTNPLLDLLRLAGVVRAEGNRFLLRNRIYHTVFDRKWIAEHMPGAELRRQRAAFRKGLLRASAVAGVITLAIGLLAATALFQASRADESTHREQAARAVAERSATLAMAEAKRANQGERQARSASAQALQANQRAQRLASLRQQALMAALFQKGRANREAERAGAAELTALREARNAARNAARADREAGTASRLLYVANINLAYQEAKAGNINRALQLLEETRAGGERTFEWGLLWRYCRPPHKTLSAPGSLEGLAFSPNGKLLLGGVRGGPSVIWDVATGAPLHRLATRPGVVYAADFAPDGRAVLTAGDHGVTQLWDPSTGRRLQEFRGGQAAVLGATFFPDSRRVATGSQDGLVRIWSLEEHALERSYSLAPASVTAIAVSPDGRRLLCGTAGGTIYVLEADSGRVVRQFRGHKNRICSLAYSTDGARIASAGDSTARLWDADTGNPLHVLNGHGTIAHRVSFSRDGRRLLSCGWDGAARIWDVETGKERRVLKGFSAGLNACALSPDGELAAAGAWDGRVRLWRTPEALDGSPPLQREVSRVSVGGAAFSPDGRLLALGTLRHTIEVWTLPDYRRVLVIPELPKTTVSLAFSPDGARLAAAFGMSASTTPVAHEGRVWDARTGKLLTVLKGFRAGLRSITYSPDGARLLTGGDDDHARVWDGRTGRNLLAVKCRGAVGGAAFTPDGRTLVTVDWTGAVTAWDAASGRELRVFRHASGILTSVAISPDGRLAASTGNTGQTEIWDLRTGREVRKIENAGEGVAFSPDGRRLATGSPDRLVRLWDVATGRELLALPGHRTEARWIAFSRDGHRLVTADIRGTTLLWGGASPLAPAAGAAWPPSGNLIVNGSFEQGDDLDGGWRVVEAGSNQIPGWEVSAGNVDRVSSHLLTSWDGEAVLDLDGIRRGAIRQTFPTVPGQSYRITFRMAGNLFAAPRYKEMRLTVAGTSQVYRFDTDSRTAGEPGWTACEWRFTARAALTTLEFASLNPEESAAGVVLDGVAVVPAPAR